MSIQSFRHRFLLADRYLVISSVLAALFVVADAATACDVVGVVAKSGNLKETGPQTFAGNASWYGVSFHGRRTASGEIFDMNKSSAAHRTLHLVTKVLVENPRSGQSAVVRVNDRGPFVLSRVMDLSRAAAIETGIFSQGVGYVECTVLGTEEPQRLPMGAR